MNIEDGLNECGKHYFGQGRPFDQNRVNAAVKIKLSIERRKARMAKVVKENGRAIVSPVQLAKMEGLMKDLSRLTSGMIPEELTQYHRRIA